MRAVKSFFIPALVGSVREPPPQSLLKNLIQAVIPSEARNLALNVFTAVRDSSSPVAPRNDRL